MEKPLGKWQPNPLFGVASGGYLTSTAYDWQAAVIPMSVRRIFISAYNTLSVGEC